MGIVALLVVVPMALGTSVEHCIRDAYLEEQEIFHACGAEYRDEMAECTSDYVDCKWDYMMCLMDLDAPVFAIECADMSLMCRQERTACTNDARDERNSCVQEAAYTYMMVRHECKFD